MEMVLQIEIKIYAFRGAVFYRKCEALSRRAETHFAGFEGFTAVARTSYKSWLWRVSRANEKTAENPRSLNRNVLQDHSVSSTEKSFRLKYVESSIAVLERP